MSVIRGKMVLELPNVKNVKKNVVEVEEDESEEEVEVSESEEEVEEEEEEEEEEVSDEEEEESESEEEVIVKKISPRNNFVSSSSSSTSLPQNSYKKNPISTSASTPLASSAVAQQQQHHHNKPASKNYEPIPIVSKTTISSVKQQQSTPPPPPQRNIKNINLYKKPADSSVVVIKPATSTTTTTKTTPPEIRPVGFKKVAPPSKTTPIIPFKQQSTGGGGGGGGVGGKSGHNHYSKKIQVIESSEDEEEEEEEEEEEREEDEIESASYDEDDDAAIVAAAPVVSSKTTKKTATTRSSKNGTFNSIAMEAKPIQVVTTGGDHTFVLDEDALTEILLENDIKDRFVVVVSVAGAFRKGKSFLLDFFLRYMYSKYHNHHTKGPDDWLGNDTEPLAGFSWRGGSERDTTGILMWSDIFLHDYPNGEKVAIILLDTQGAFDSQSTVRDCATVFALSTMLSSVQIFNLSQNIQEDDLQHLQLFTEYGRLALADSGKKPFQRLQFLVRDWSFPYEAEYGPVGGQTILKRRLELSDKQHPELQSLRKHITSCFAEIACFLMPHPGLNVATNPNFDGRLAAIEPEFKQNLKLLIPMLLAPENLILKQINGQKVRARDLIQYFKSYMAIYKGNELPEPKSMLVATAEANNLTAVAVAKETYTQLMEEVCGGTRPYLSTGHLEAEHLRIKEKSLNQFSSKRKMGGEEFSQKYLDQLDLDLEEQFNSFKSHNESKNIFKAARTPSVFFVISIATYVLSGIFNLVGLYTFGNFFTLVMGAALIILAIWGYIRYSGEFAGIGVRIDDIASLIWENFMKPIYQGCMEKGVQHVATHAASAAIGAATSTPTSSPSYRTHANGSAKVKSS